GLIEVPRMPTVGDRFTHNNIKDGRAVRLYGEVMKLVPQPPQNRTGDAQRSDRRARRCRTGTSAPGCKNSKSSLDTGDWVQSWSNCNDRASRSPLVMKTRGIVCSDSTLAKAGPPSTALHCGCQCSTSWLILVLSPK